MLLALGGGEGVEGGVGGVRAVATFQAAGSWAGGWFQGCALIQGCTLRCVVLALQATGWGCGGKGVKLCCSGPSGHRRGVRWLGGGEEFVEHGVDDANGGVEAVGGDVVEVVAGVVPPVGGGEIADDVEGGDADGVEGDVVVEDGGGALLEMFFPALGPGDAEEEIGELLGGIGGDFDGEVFVADHVEEEAELRFVVLSSPVGGVAAAAVESVAVGKLGADGFFAVEEDEFELLGPGGGLGEAGGEFEDGGGGGGGVVGAEEDLVVEEFGVEVGAEDTGNRFVPEVGAVAVGGMAGDEVDEGDLSLGGEGGEFAFLGDPAVLGEGVGEVGAGFPEGLGGGGAGAEGEDGFGVGVGGFASGGFFSAVGEEAAGEGDEHSAGEGGGEGEPGHDAGRIKGRPFSRP